MKKKLQYKDWAFILTLDLFFKTDRKPGSPRFHRLTATAVNDTGFSQVFWIDDAHKAEQINNAESALMAMVDSGGKQPVTKELEALGFVTTDTFHYEGERDV